MTRKQYSFVLVLLFMVLSLPFSGSATHHDPITGDSLNIPPNAIGKVTLGNGIQIFTNRLVPTFQTGATITSFHILHKNDHWLLMRVGEKTPGLVTKEFVRIHRTSNNFLVVGPAILYAKQCRYSACSSGCAQTTLADGTIDCYCEAGGCTPNELMITVADILISP